MKDHVPEPPWAPDQGKKRKQAQCNFLIANNRVQISHILFVRDI